MRLLGLSIAAIILLGATGCYWGYYHYGHNPYYSHGYYADYNAPRASVSYYEYDPWAPYVYRDYTPYEYRTVTHRYPYYPAYYPTRYYRYDRRHDDRYDRRYDSRHDRHHPHGSGSFLGKLRPGSAPSPTPAVTPPSSSGSFLRKFR